MRQRTSSRVVLSMSSTLIGELRRIAAVGSGVASNLSMPKDASIGWRGWEEVQSGAEGCAEADRHGRIRHRRCKRSVTVGKGHLEHKADEAKRRARLNNQSAAANFQFATTRITVI
jgi:uncharacterized protein YcaQ